MSEHDNAAGFVALHHKGGEWRPAADIRNQPGTVHADLDAAEREAAGIRDQGDQALVMALYPVHDNDLAVSLTGINFCRECGGEVTDDEAFVLRWYGLYHAEHDPGEEAFAATEEQMARLMGADDARAASGF